MSLQITLRLRLSLILISCSPISDTIRGVLSESDQQKNVHRSVIAVANLVCGVLIFMAVPILFVIGDFFAMAPTPAEASGEVGPATPIFMAGFITLVVLGILSFPFFMAGWGLLKGKSWGAGFAIVAGVLNLLNFLFGTALAIYTFWAASKGHLKS